MFGSVSRDKRSSLFSTSGIETEIIFFHQISVDILAEMSHDDLKQIGVMAYGHRHKLIKGIEKLVSGNGELRCAQIPNGGIPSKENPQSLIYGQTLAGRRKPRPSFQL